MADVPGGRLTDHISLGVLASAVPRDVVDEAVAACGRGARRAGGKLPPHVMVYFAMALALFAAEDYEQVAVRLAGTLASWGCWDDAWSAPTSGGISQARTRLGFEPVARVFEQVAAPVAGLDTAGAFLGPWRLMAIDGVRFDVPDSAANAAGFGYAGGAGHGSAFPKARVLTVTECGSHVPVAAVIGAADAAEQVLAKALWPRLEPGWLVLADRGFYTWDGFAAAAATGADLAWRIRKDHVVSVVQELPDGSAAGLLITPKLHWGSARDKVVGQARQGQDLDPELAVPVRLIEYTVPDRVGSGKGETIRLVTTITDWTAAPAAVLAATYHQRWEIETGYAQIKTVLRGPGRVLRSQSPDLVLQEIYGYLLTAYAINALICNAATGAGIDPDRVKFTRTVRIIRQTVGQAPAFPP